MFDVYEIKEAKRGYERKAIYICGGWSILSEATQFCINYLKRNPQIGELSIYRITDKKDKTMMLEKRVSIQTNFCE